ncbi:hypothetical protein TWF173_004586 [Orbilia oligospora]|nr:hypothetical protein TWF173_004586 [Orbilia oligospora]
MSTRELIERSLETASEGGLDVPISEEEYPHQIYDVARICDDMFTSSLQIGVREAKIKGFQQKFWAWSSNIGVFAAPWMSLDQRLKGHPDLQRLFILLLETLRRNLGYYAVDAAFEGIDGSIDRLQRLNTAIRKFSKDGLIRRVASHSMGSDLSAFINFVSAYVNCKFQFAEDGLKEQLKKSLVYRRQRLDYQGAHQRRLAAKRQDLKPQEKEVPLEKSPEIKRVPNSPTAPKLPTTLSHKPSRPSTLDPKKINHMKQEMALNEITAPINRAPSIFTGDIRADYPPTPNPKPGESNVKCPICCQELELFTSNKQWRHHVDEDLESYICVSEQCGHFPVYFTDRMTWVQHMEDNHTLNWPQLIHRGRSWRCTVGHDIARDFDSKESAMQHMIDFHSKLFKKEHISTIIENSEIPKSRPHNICPLCCCTVGDETSTLGGAKEISIASSKEQIDNTASENISEALQPQKSQKNPRRGVRFADDLNENHIPAHKWGSNATENTGARPNKEFKSNKMVSHIGDHLKALAFQSLYDPIQDADIAHSKPSEASSSSNLSFELSQDDLDSLGDSEWESLMIGGNQDLDIPDVHDEQVFTNKDLISSGNEEDSTLENFKRIQHNQNKPPRNLDDNWREKSIRIAEPEIANYSVG